MMCPNLVINKEGITTCMRSNYNKDNLLAYDILSLILLITLIYKSSYLSEFLIASLRYLFQIDSNIFKYIC